MKKWIVAVAVMVALCSGAAWAQGLEKGNTEVQFALDFTKQTDVAKRFDVLASAGYLFTDHIEGGASINYTRVSPETPGPTASQGSIGVMGAWNFSPRQVMTPYVAVQILPIFLGGSRDTANWAWELSAGLKYYPYHNAGYTANIFYGKTHLKGGGDTAGEYGLRAGLLFKF